MKQFGSKFKLIFVPFVGLTVATVAIYTFLNWLLFIYAHIYPLDEVVLNIFAPMIVPAIPILIWLRPRIKLLDLKSNGKDAFIIFIIFAWIGMLAPTVVAQEYLITASGKLTKLDRASQINSQPQTKYYSIKHLFIDKKLVVTKTTSKTSGTNDENFDMTIYAPCPIFDDDPSPAINPNATPTAWLAIEYHKTIRNSLSQGEKQLKYEEFVQESQHYFDGKQLDKFVYLDRIGPGSDLKNYSAAVNSKNSSPLAKPVIILSPVNEPFEARNGHKLGWIFGTFCIGAMIFMILLLFKPLKAGEDIIIPEEAEKSSALSEIKVLFFPRAGYYVTPIIVDVNLAIFIIMVFGGLGFLTFNGPDLLKYGANYRPDVISGQYWRLLTNIFLHGGLMHVLLNMYGLVFVGLFLEPVIGRSKYALAYLGTGIIASLVSIWWHPATVSIGASGAIFGMYGVFLALLTTKIFPAELKWPFLISTSVFVVVNLIAGLSGGIDNAAHIGGLLSGLLCGYAMYPAIKTHLDESQPVAAPKQLPDNN